MTSVSAQSRQSTMPSATGPALVADAHALSQAEVLAELHVAAAAGLDDAEVARRQAKFGANSLTEGKRRSALAIFFDQFRSIIVYLLAAAAFLSILFAQWTEGGAIVAVLAINAAIGFLF